ncbi:serine/threonine-protein kinase SRPK3 [Seiridium cupressi]
MAEMTQPEGVSSGLDGEGIAQISTTNPPVGTDQADEDSTSPSEDKSESSKELSSPASSSSSEPFVDDPVDDGIAPVQDPLGHTGHGLVPSDLDIGHGFVPSGLDYFGRGLVPLDAELSGLGIVPSGPDLTQHGIVTSSLDEPVAKEKSREELPKSGEELPFSHKFKLAAHEAEGNSAFGDDEDRFAFNHYKDEFTFSEEETYEDYIDAGFYPIKLGDVIIGRFEIFHKLGRGGYGTVWLVYDGELKKWRALKIIGAMQSHQDCQDLKILNLMREKGMMAQNLDVRHILIPCEEPFEIDSPGGDKNLCLVFPLMGPNVLSMRSWKPSAMRQIFYQLAEGLEFLHQNNICHGDLRTENLLLYLNQDELHKISKKDMIQRLGEAQAIEVPTELWKEHHPKLPTHILKTADLNLLGVPYTQKAAIIDFGIAFEVSNPTGHPGIPPTWAAPEAYFNVDFGLSADVWSLAATIAQVYADAYIFHGSRDSDGVVNDLEFVLGPLPEPYRTAYYEEKWQKLKERKTSGSEVNSQELGKPNASNEVSNDNSSDDPHVSQERIDYPEAISGPTAELENVRRGFCEEHDQPTVVRATLSQSREMHYRIPLSRPDEETRDNDDDLFGGYRDLVEEKKLSSKEVAILGDLLDKVFQYDPADRIDIAGFLTHEWFGDHEAGASDDDLPAAEGTEKGKGKAKVEVVPSSSPTQSYGLVPISQAEGSTRPTKPAALASSAGQAQPAQKKRDDGGELESIFSKDPTQARGSVQMSQTGGPTVVARNKPCKESIHGPAGTVCTIILGILVATSLWLPIIIALIFTEKQRQPQTWNVHVSLNSPPAS